jgi:uncharacterized membrane protein YphA (DoxX/SURF4 family)
LKEAREKVKKVREKYPTDPAHYTDVQKKEYEAALDEEIRWSTPVLEPAQWPMQEWGLREWTDNVVKWGLLGVGICLLAGFLTRTACVVGALFLLSFYLAMPPLPGLPESPRAEGHYLIINKNIIEMLALLALATTRSGRWCGLDGLLQFFNPWRWQRRPIVRSQFRDADSVPVSRSAKPETAVAASSHESSKESSHGA